MQDKEGVKGIAQFRLVLIRNGLRLRCLGMCGPEHFPDGFSGHGL